MLDSNDVFIVDCGSELYVWTGSGASDKERRSAMQTAVNFLSTQTKPLHTPIHSFREGQKITNEHWNTIFDY